MNSLNRVPWFLTLVVVATIVLLIGCEDEERSGSGSTTIVTGVWLDVAGDNSTTTVTLVQSDNTVTGMFFDQNGWTGTVTGNVDRNCVSLTYTYSDGYVVYNRATVNGEQMAGTFESDDGKRCGTWSARRLEDGHAGEDVSTTFSEVESTQPEDDGIVEPPSTIRYKQLSLFVGPAGRPPEIDINDDGRTDLQLDGYMMGTDDVPSSEQEMFLNIIGGTFVYPPIPSGTMISSNLPQPYAWQSAGYGVTLTSRHYAGDQPWPWTGPWAYVTNGYLAVEISASGSVHYGWVRMSAPNDGELSMGMTVHDCAYESVPGKGILAGATE